ncbi:uncharacterized protein LOC127837841 isoform X3 [Dreissena polymorpha]|uniref:uncharacterized protein LOC127837841 isoform X3 n=1 Tax=Dreissena polymorpha TaxID=45954 RepID=UPI002263EDD5|nr:uncharacterized protein LOC127837841 isoform X3 [Dreissena polymorpha]
MAVQVHVDETSCGPLCQHPACWQSNIRQEKGFPKLKPRPRTPPDIELDLPTLKVCNMLEDYGDDSRDLFPARFGGKPAHERKDPLYEWQQPNRQQSVKVTRAPQTSPKSGTIEHPMNKFKVVEVQEVFDPQDLQGTWDDTFVPKSYYVWVPNQKKKRRKKHRLAKSESKTGAGGLKNKPGIKDLTESMVPKEIENMRLTARPEEFPVLKKKRAQRSPRPYPMTPMTAMTNSKMEFDQEGFRSYSSNTFSSGDNQGITELLELPRDILVQVLENTRQSDLMSKDRIREIIRRFMPLQFERGNTNVSITSQDLLQQKKLALHEGNKNLRQPQLMETKPVFYLDEDVVDEVDEDRQRPGSPYGSLKELYFGGNGQVGDLNRYTKPLPAISGQRSASAGATLATKIPSISLGLPELPSGIRHTKPFTYKKQADFDFTLGPVPTPPTSYRSTETPGSDHGTAGRANMPSEVSNRSEHGSDTKKMTSARSTPDRPLHNVSPTFSTRVPKAPATTPATNQPSSPTKSVLRDITGSTIPASPGDWAMREKSTSPLQIIRAPVNTPGSLMQETGLGTIHESHQDETGDQLPMSRGRSVRFEIPEVPPPPSSPQLSDDGQKDISRNTVTISTTLPNPDAVSTSTNYKPQSGGTIRTDVNTVNTSNLMAENSFVRSQTREVSFVTSPEPWPQVNEADFQDVPKPSPGEITHDTATATPVTITTGHGLSEIDERRDKEKERAKKTLDLRAPIKVPSPEKEDTKDSEDIEKTENYVNKTPVDENSSALRRLMEDSRKTASPAPPPPSPEAKQDSNASLKKMESSSRKPQDDDSEMTVVQIAPRGLMNSKKGTTHRKIDTFQNIDIPAKVDATLNDKEELTLKTATVELSTETILEEPEHTPEHEDEHVKTDGTQEKSTLGNRSLSEPSTPGPEPVASEVKQTPGEADKTAGAEVFTDWTGPREDPEGAQTGAVIVPDMTEEGGDHEGFMEDLRQAYQTLERQISEEFKDD